MKHKISDWINRVLFWLLSCKVRLQKKSTNESGILLVRFSHIGDFIVWLDAAKEFRKIYPNENITFLCYAYKNVQYIAEKLDYFDEVMIADTNGKARFRSLAKMLKKRYRIVINANPSRSILSDLYALAPYAEQRIAQMTDSTCMKESFISKSDKQYDRVIACDGIKTMELIRNGQFISGLSGKEYRSTIPYLKNLENRKLNLGYYFTVCPGGETPLKYWEEQKFKEVIDYIFERDKKIKCVIIGSAEEIGIGERIKASAADPNRVLLYSGKTDMEEYIEIIRNAAYLISDDTSAVHIAAATDTQSFVVAVSWDKGRFHPYVDEKDTGRKLPIAIHANISCEGCGLKNINMKNPQCVENGRMRCISRIQSRDVIEQVKKIYEGDENVSSVEKNYNQSQGQNQRQLF